MTDQSRRVPADRGLSGLGLIMQLCGSLFAAMSAMFGVFMLIQLGHLGGRAGGSMLMYMLLLAGTGIARSLMHRQAGADLLYGTSPFASVKRYLIMSLVNTGAWILILKGEASLPFSFLLPFISMLLAWPIALTVALNLPAYQGMRDRVPAGEDKGFEGASLLMLMFGLIGVIGTSVALYALWSAAPHSGGWFMLLMVSLLVLLVRSFLHVNAGLLGLRETRLDQVVQSANRYADFGVIAAFVTGGCLLISVMMLAADITAMVGIACITWMLLAWPMTVRRFFSERQFADILATNGDATKSEHRRAPDLGLTTLGWFLFGTALVSLAYTLPAQVFLGAELREMRGSMSEMGMLGSIFNPVMGHSPWFGIGLSAFQLWAGIELIRMGELHRIAATAFGAVATAVNLYIFWPMISNLGSLGRHGGMGEMVVMLAVLAMQLIVPVTTLIAANRSHVPGATARFTST